MEAFAAAIPGRIDALWDFDAVADTQQRFQELLDEALALAPPGGDAPERDDRAAALGRRFPQVLELLTQIARTQGLQRAFDDAHATLDRVQRALSTPPRTTTTEPLDRSARLELPTRANVRYLLERGRVFNSSKQPAFAVPLFVHAWEMAQRCSPVPEEDLEVDAAHMVAIAEPTAEKQTEWNLRAIARAETTTNAKARKWIGSLTNNLGWAYHGAGRFEDALAMFEKALAYREQAGEAKSIVIAKWCKARCLRSLGRVDEALAIQQELTVENEKLGAPDGYNFEELGELLLLKGEEAQAKVQFARAVELLSADAWFAETEKERLARLTSLANGVSA